ncbi:MAG: hypothetical protein EPO32_02770 [Anaerolineae bacterium]|nr:MAG: hypothetical protein EPO32_02770 [Anaerolineae bacterium]
MRIRSSDRKIFQPRGRDYRWPLSLMALVLLGFFWFLNGYLSGRIQPLFLPTPTPTRTAGSYVEEGLTNFAAGNLDAAISAYQDAVNVDPNNVAALIELARIQTYSSPLLTPALAVERLEQARANVDQAVLLDDLNSNAHAVRTLVYDWSAGRSLSVEEREAYLATASQAAVRAVQLDSRNALALAYRAEVLMDQFQFDQARQVAELAVSLEPNSMDTHRVFAYILESTGFYSRAIEEYQAAAALMPNYTYLYIKIGQNYRQLELYAQALEYFDRAAQINATLGINDPLPYVAIAKTYTRQGEFFIAARNAERALEFDPTNATIYGELGIIRFRARNYEGSIPPLRCAVVGCTAAENEDQEVAVVGLPLDNNSVAFYYTYGSVLAALNMCDEGEVILNQVLSLYRSDDIIRGIAEEGLAVCRTLRAGGQVPTATPPVEEDMGEGTP